MIIRPSLLKFSLFLALILIVSGITYRLFVRDDSVREISISFKIRVLNDEEFQIYYLNDSEVEEYSIERRIFKRIKADTAFQQIRFDLPLSVVPEKFRFDLGEKKIQSCLAIEEVTITNGKSILSIKPLEYQRYFIPNIYTDHKNSYFCRNIVESRYDPFIESTDLLKKKLEMEFR